MRRGVPCGYPFFVGDFFLYSGTGADAWVRGAGTSRRPYDTKSNAKNRDIIPHMPLSRAIMWIVILVTLVIGAGLYWFFTREFKGQAAETVNIAHTEALTGSNLGLVGYWTFDGNDVKWSDTTTEIKDTSGNSRHGDAQGSLATTSVTPGRIGQSISFNGTSDLVSLGNVYNGIKTVSFWVKPNSTTQPFIDLNGTATINVTSGTVAANSFTSPTIYIDGSLPPPSPVAYRSSSATTYASRTNTTLTAPSGIQNGDLLVIIFDIGAASPPTPTPPAGFSALPSFSSPLSMTAGGFTVNMYAWYKFASSESGNYTVTHSSASSQGYIVALSGADPTTPFSPNPTTNTGTGSTTTATGLTTPRDNSLIMFVSSDWGDTANNLTGPTGSTPTFTKRMGSTSQSGILYVADGVLGTAGATGDKTITNNSNGSGAWGGVLISVEPSSTPGSPTISDTSWHHVVVTTNTGINASATNIGKISSSYFGGILDDIRFYSTALSSTQVSDLYQSSGAKEVDNAAHRNALTNGLVGYWTFDGRDIKWSDTTTEIKDISGNSNHGDAAGSLATTSVTPGKLGQALSFNGSSDYISVTDPGSGSTLDFGNSASLSLSMWVYPTALSSEASLISKDTQADCGYNTNYTVYYYNGGDYGGCTASACPLWFDYVASGVSNHKYYTQDQVITLNTWRHIIITYTFGTGSSMKMYVDGQLQTGEWYFGTGNGSPVTSDQPIWIGASNYCGGLSVDIPFTGRIDDVRIYNRALSATEIANLYNMGR